MVACGALERRRFDMPIVSSRSGAVCFAVIFTAHAPRVFAEPLSLEKALALAAERSPEIRAAELDVEIAEGELMAAETLPFNPEIGARAGPALGRDETAIDAEVEVEQTIELGGKRGDRTRAAEARRDAAKAR